MDKAMPESMAVLSIAHQSVVQAHGRLCKALCGNDSGDGLQVHVARARFVLGQTLVKQVQRLDACHSVLRHHALS